MKFLSKEEAKKKQKKRVIHYSKYSTSFSLHTFYHITCQKGKSFRDWNAHSPLKPHLNYLSNKTGIVYYKILGVNGRIQQEDTKVILVTLTVLNNSIKHTFYKWQWWTSPLGMSSMHGKELHEITILLNCQKMVHVIKLQRNSILVEVHIVNFSKKVSDDDYNMDKDSLQRSLQKHLHYHSQCAWQVFQTYKVKTHQYKHKRIKTNQLINNRNNMQTKMVKSLEKFYIWDLSLNMQIWFNWKHKRWSCNSYIGI